MGSARDHRKGGIGMAGRCKTMVPADKVRRCIDRYLRKHPQVTLPMIVAAVNGTDARRAGSIDGVMSGRTVDVHRDTVDRLRYALQRLATEGGGDGEA